MWDEYGFQTAERGDFATGDRKVNISVWQMKDTTGALAAMQWLQPGVVQHGNYVLRVEGHCHRQISRDLKPSFRRWTGRRIQFCRHSCRAAIE